MNLRRLKLWSDAFALLAFVAPTISLLICVFLIKFSHTLAWAWARITLTYLLIVLVPLCGFGSVTFVVLGSLEKQRRVLWQGVFGLGVSAMLFFVKAALGIWLLTHG